MKITRCLLGLLVAVPMASQAGLVISADAGDSPLVITGWLDEGTGFSGNLRLTARHDPSEGADTGRVSILMLASDLRSGDGKWTVSRQNVSLGGNPVLQPGVPQDFQVTVSGITEPGTYQGMLELLQSGAARTEALALDLEVIARIHPNLKPLASAEKLRLDLVNCQNRLSCGLAGLLLPESAFLNQWQMQFDNPSAAEANLIKSAVVVLGEKTRFQLSSDQLTLPAGPQNFPAYEISSLPVTLNRAAMAPDHYLGSLYLMLQGAKDRLTIPLDMNVRTGPLWPLLAILAGIILGRLVKYMQERGGPQAAKLAEVNRLEMMLNQAHDEDGAILGPQVAAVRSKVYRHELDTVTEDLKTIEARLETLSKLRDMEHDLNAEEASPERDKVLQQIAEARRRVAEGQDVRDLVAEIKQTIEQLKQGLIAKGLPDAALQHALKTGDEAETAAGKAKASLESVGTVNSGLRWIRNTLFALSGLSEELRAEATLWIVRPLLYFGLLFALVAVGLNTLYVSSGLTFGATPFADYLGLVLWGLSADVAGRTLSNLQGTSVSGKGQ